MGTRGGSDEERAGLWPIKRALVTAVATAVVALGGLTVAMVAWATYTARPGSLSTPDLLEVLKLVLATVAGAGALFALVMAYRRQRLAEFVEARERIRIADDQTRVYNERFAMGVGLLGHDAPAVRLAGVYAIAGLADDWEHGRQTCIDVLCAHIRMPYDPGPGPEAPAAEQMAFLRDRQARHTAIGVIGARLRPWARVSWEGYDFDLRGAVFDGGDLACAMFSSGTADFSNSVFASGRVDFGGAVFCGAFVHFDHAQFSGGETSFAGATFSGGEATFHRAAFTGGHVDFDNADFCGTIVDFEDAAFSGGTVVFRGATFSSGRVSFVDATFSAGLVDFGEANFSGGDVAFDSGGLIGGRVDFHSPGDWTKPPTGLPIAPNGEIQV